MHQRDRDRHRSVLRSLLPFLPPSPVAGTGGPVSVALFVQPVPAGRWRRRFAA